MVLRAYKLITGAFLSNRTPCYFWFSYWSTANAAQTFHMILTYAVYSSFRNVFGSSGNSVSCAEMPQHLECRNYTVGALTLSREKPGQKAPPPKPVCTKNRFTSHAAGAGAAPAAAVHYNNRMHYARVRRARVRLRIPCIMCNVARIISSARACGRPLLCHRRRRRVVMLYFILHANAADACYKNTLPPRSKPHICRNYICRM